MKLLRSIMNVLAPKQGKDQMPMEEAEAVVLEIDPIHNGHGSQTTRILFKVTPRDKRNFVAEYRNHIPEHTLTGLRIGTSIKIYYNPKSPSKIHLSRPSQSG